jgi:tRNA pseudouridine(55) synthase
MKLPPYLTVHKAVGETPLQAIERLRIEKHIPREVPLAYAGRLDPMASGKLLVLIGDECKKQEQYHAFDKSYTFEVLIGLGSDTGDVLGLITRTETKTFTQAHIKQVLNTLIGNISLPYPHFSSRTVHGKPLHTWTLEGRLSEIEVPIKHSRTYALTLEKFSTYSAKEIYASVAKKIETIPLVTDPRKALGADFRRDAVRASWSNIASAWPDTLYQIAQCCCTASSGTYMRSLAEELGTRLGTRALAYSIHRTRIGVYVPLTRRYGFWRSSF